ncbi:hypothetical protein F5B22DRAFT_606389 [Xylaria bambusicola]|uniref:uncharacterized protein n=1 Tax=Xylaria bambusicola TaxID=326684 RepID=UPI002008328A|nr:uncharacterized protein F5B22DRAFT_606389 [Xylaria bambusicola]KAI0516751.1 hypothetical protein F5B22DRAFT_606389 [Xylaria bambusicola]
MYASSTLTTIMALVTAALATTGPCSISEPDYTCEPVMDASACYNAIILGWEGASKNPADIFKCVDPPELMCACYGCTDGLDELVNKNNLCPYNGTSLL